ncbi:uricase [Ramaria rubella]|nr:uricase [Ramaria rubella]
MALAAARYGKDLVRVFRIVREAEAGVHEVAEYNVCALVEGEIDVSFTKADNSVVVATDSNLAKTSPHVLSPELFATHIGAFLLDKYAHLKRAYVDVERLRWTRIEHGPNAQGHKHSFRRDGDEKHVVRAEIVKQGSEMEVNLTAGLVDLLLLKSSGSSFSGFVRDEFTTLPEVDDRILSTAVDMTYTFPVHKLTGLGAIGQMEEKYGFQRAAEKSREITLEIFCDDSASVQATLYDMGKALIAAHAAVSSVSYVLPNKHYIPVDMSYIGVDNVKGRAAEVFAPVGAPSGRISATITRMTS